MASKKKGTKPKSGASTKRFKLVLTVTVKKDGSVSVQAGPVSPIPPVDPWGSSSKTSKKKKKKKAAGGTKNLAAGGPTSPITPVDPGGGG